MMQNEIITHLIILPLSDIVKRTSVDRFFRILTFFSDKAVLFQNLKFFKNSMIDWN